MGQGNQTTNRLSEDPSDQGKPVSRVADLMVVTSRLRLGQPAPPTPEHWREGLAQLLEWLGIDVEFVTAERSRRLPKVADWVVPAGRNSSDYFTIFAPWLAWSPVALQQGGAPGLPQALFMASYLIEHDRGQAVARGGIDLVLMSPHPAVCAVDQAGEAPLPRLQVLEAMIRTAKAEGRDKLAIILHAHQRNALARKLLSANRGLTRDGLNIEILTIEEALSPLGARTSPWDAIIAMPDLRGIVFTMLAEASGVKGPWPMLWHGGERGRELPLITSEAIGGGGAGSALDASVLIHALALCLHHAGSVQAARRLYEAWSRLRDSGVTVAGRGQDAPYVTQVRDSDFIAMLCHGAGVSRRPVRAWRALGCPEPVDAVRQPSGLRVVASNVAV